MSDAVETAGDIGEDVLDWTEEAVGGSSDAEQALWAAQAEQVMQQLAREEELYPVLKDILRSMPGEETSALQAKVSPVDKVYKDAMGQIDDYSLPQEALDALGNVRDERIAGLQGAADELIGSKMADLARRGVTSSSTAEGSMKQVGNALLPAIKEANADYWTQRLNLPTTNAFNKYNMAQQYGGFKGGAINDFTSRKFAPYQDIWQTAATGGLASVGEDPSANSKANILQFGTQLAAMLA